MPRPKRCRRICQVPDVKSFSPNISTNNVVKITLDEYEVIRLIDYFKYTHEECAKMMDISRTTVTEIYEIARFKVSDALINAKILKIEGGNYRVCDGDKMDNCQVRCCKKTNLINNNTDKKGDNIMRIAVCYENNEVFQHFGHTQNFKLYDIEEGVIVDTKLIDTSGSGHCALAQVLVDYNVDVLICGGLGQGAINALTNAQIKVYPGVTGNADKAVEALINDSLVATNVANCDHHGHHHDHENENHECHCHDDGHKCHCHEE